jgi:hypothetical protein
LTFQLSKKKSVPNELEREMKKLSISIKNLAGQLQTSRGLEVAPQKLLFLL